MLQCDPTPEQIELGRDVLVGTGEVFHPGPGRRRKFCIHVIGVGESAYLPDLTYRNPATVASAVNNYRRKYAPRARYSVEQVAGRGGVLITRLPDIR